MSLRQMPRAGESGGRRATIREVLPQLNQERMPSSTPYPKPTRDISASNKSQSILHHEVNGLHSERRILEREAEERQYEKQANKLYIRQFRTLGKILGNETMDFDQLKEKIQGLLISSSSIHFQQQLKLKVAALERELNRKEGQWSAQQIPRKEGLRASQMIAGSQYTRAIQNQLERKNKLITELSDSIKRQDFEEAFRGYQVEVAEKTNALRSLEEQLQGTRSKSSHQINILEEEIIKRNQTMQKLTFELDTLKRKFQSNLEETERLKRREKELMASLETETRANYQGIPYSIHALLQQLQARDCELQQSLQIRKSQVQQGDKLREIIQSYEGERVGLENAFHELQNNTEYYKSLSSRQTHQMEQLRQEKDQLSRGKSILERQLRDSSQLVSGFQKQQSIWKLEKINFENEIVQLKSNLQKSNGSHKELMNQLEEKEKQIKQLQQLIKEEKTSQKSMQQTSQSIQEQLQEQMELRNQIEYELRRRQVEFNASLSNYDQHIRELQLKEIKYLEQIRNIKSAIQQKNHQAENCGAQIKNLNLKTASQQEELAFYQSENNGLRSHVQSLELECNNLRLAIQEQSFEMNDNKKKLQQLETYEKKVILLQSQQQAHQKTLEQYNDLKSKLEEQEEQLSKLRQSKYLLEQYTIKISTLEQQLSRSKTFQKDYQSSSTQLQIISKDLNQSHRLQQEYLAKLAELQQQLQFHHELRVQVQMLREKVNEKTKQLIEFNNHISLLEKQLQDYHQLKSQAAQMKVQLQKQNHIINEYIQHVKSLKEELGAQNLIKQQVEELRTRIKQKDEELNQNETHFANLKEKISLNSFLQEEVSSLKNKVNELQHELNQNSSQIELLSEEKNRNTVLEQQIFELKGNEQKLRIILQEAIAKENHYEIGIENYVTQINELKEELNRYEDMMVRQRGQMNEKLQILQEQLEQQKERYEEEVRLKTEALKDLQLSQVKIKQLQETNQQLQVNSIKSKQQLGILQQEIAAFQIKLSDQRNIWFSEKNNLNHLIQKLSEDENKVSETNKIIMHQYELRHQKQKGQLENQLHKLKETLISLEQEKQYYVVIVNELNAEKQQRRSLEMAEPVVSNKTNELESYSFNYFERNNDQVNTDNHNNREKEELIARTEELQKIVDSLKHELDQKNGSLRYSRSQEQDSLKLILNSLQTEKDEVQQSLKRLQSEGVPKLQAQNAMLKQKQISLTQRMNNLQQGLQLKETEFNQIKNKHILQVTEIKRSYEQIIKQHEKKYQVLIDQLNRFERQTSQLRIQNKTELQKVSQGQGDYKIQIQTFKKQINDLKAQEIRLNQKLSEIQVLRGDISVLKEQVLAFRNECDMLRTAIRQLQGKNSVLESKNKQLQLLLKRENEQQKFNNENRILSRLSRKSNVSSVGENKKDLQNSKHLSSDGQLSQKILNYDPSKISGQQSKFLPHIVFENSKIQVIKQTVHLPEEEIQIKEHKYEESVISKHVIQKQKQNSQSSVIPIQRVSEGSKKQIVIHVSEEQLAKQKIVENQSNQQKPSVQNINTTKKRESQYSIANKLNDSIHSIVKNEEGRQISECPPVQRLQLKKQQYLPQQSSKKSIVNSNTNISKKQILQQNLTNKNNIFQRKSQFIQITPVYISRPTIIENSQQNSRRDSSNSRSNSKNKVTITYGQPVTSDRLIQVRKTEIKKEVNETGGLKMKESLRQLPQQNNQFNQQMPLEHPINEVSPVALKQSQHIQSMRQSIFSNRQKVLDEHSNIQVKEISILQGKNIQSESIINGIIGPRFSSIRPSFNTKQDASRNSVLINRESINIQQPVRESIASPRISNVYFNSVKSSNNLISTRQNTLTNPLVVLPPSQLTRTVEVKKEQSKIVQNISQPQQSHILQARHSLQTPITQITSQITPRFSQIVQTHQSQTFKPEPVPEPQSQQVKILQGDPTSTPVRVSLKRVSNGRQLNSAMTDTVTFGLNSQRQESDMSLSQDSGIQVMQYDWTAPCCKNQQ